MSIRFATLRSLLNTTHRLSSSSKSTLRAFIFQMIGCAVVISTVLGFFQSTSVSTTLQHSSLSAFSFSLPYYYYSTDPSSSSFSTSTSAITTTPVIHTPDPPATATLTGESFSACLLWMDDNPRLPEWIAYHYYMLNLTYLVVGIAPGAKSLGPHSILQRWRDRITIKVWKLQASHENKKDERRNNDSMQVDYTLMDVKEVKHGDSHKKYWNQHKDRQTRFYQTCAFFLKDQNRTWTAFHDVDEYIVLRSDNSSGNGTSSTQNSVTNISTSVTTTNGDSKIIPLSPGIVLQYLQKYNHDHDTLSEVEFNATWNFWSIHSPCLQIPRVLFGAVPSTDAEVMRGVPTELIFQLLNTSNSTSMVTHNNQSVSTAAVDFVRQLVTLNYRYQSTKSRHNHVDMDGAPKVVMDVSKMDPVTLLRSSSSTPNFRKYAPSGSAHRPFREFCPYAPFWFTEFKKPPYIPLRIHHYLGSWELYSFRQGDTRRGGNRNHEVWAEGARGQAGGVQDEYVRPWLAGFVAHVGGVSTAHTLLQDAGLPPNYRLSESYTRSWSYDNSTGVNWDAKHLHSRRRNITKSSIGSSLATDIATTGS